MNEEKNINQPGELENQEKRNQSTEKVVIPVIHEKIQIDKKTIETGRVLVSKTVTEQEEFINIPITNEETEVERIPLNQYIDNAPPAVRYEGETMIIPILHEVMVTEKRLLLVEEVRITKRKVEKFETQKVVLRTEHINIQRTAPDNNPELKT